MTYFLNRYFLFIFKAKSQAKSATVSVQKSDGVNGSNPIKVEESASNLMMQMNQPFILLQRAQVNQLAVKPIPVTGDFLL